MKSIPHDPRAYRLVHEGTLALAKVEAAGIKIDVAQLDRSIVEAGEKARALRKEMADSEFAGVWRKRFWHSTNLNSPDQLATILFDVMGFKCEVRTKSGKPATDEKTLAAIDHPFVRSYVDAKRFDKARTTYLRGIKREVVVTRPGVGWLRPSFSLHLAQTHRSCVAKGMLVSMADHTLKRIEDTQVGDEVKCLDYFDRLTSRTVLWAGQTGVRRVMRLRFQGAGGSRGSVDVTPEHRVRINEGYARADELRYGQMIRGDEIRAVLEKEDLEGVVPVYDIEVECEHNFIVNGVCVHNSSQDPNFQNLPIRIPWLKQMVRSCIVARKKRRILEVDYGGVEVCGAACHHKDPTMVHYIKTKHDMHRDTAIQIYKLKPEQMAKPIRDAAKSLFVFAQFYGDYYLHCAKGLWEASASMVLADGTPMREHLARKGIKRLGKCVADERPVSGTFEHHVQTIERDFWQNRFPVYTQWKLDWMEAYKRRGWLKTKWGFICQGFMKRNQVVNFPIQSASFHCLLWSLIEIQKEIERRGLRCLIIGQIHDSIVFDCPDEERDEVLVLCREVMVERLYEEQEWTRVVPFTIEAEQSPVGGSWYEKEGVAIPRA